jgi:hypothetical protein
MDPDIRQAMEERGLAARAPVQVQAGLIVELHPDGSVHVRAGWLGEHQPRTPAPPMTTEQVGLADLAARALLGATLGEMTRTPTSAGFVYRRHGLSASVTV